MARPNPSLRKALSSSAADVGESERATSPTEQRDEGGALMVGRKPRVTQLDIARVAGVHNTTVSLALRNSPAISAPVRQRIQALAEELGYRPDPALRALVSYRKGLAAFRRAEPLAYITSGPTRWGWRDVSAEERHHRGAERKAAEYGYQLEHFWLGEPGMNPRRLSSVLFNRGITGIILAANRGDAGDGPDLEWDDFSAVKLGSVPNAPAMHCVANDLGGAVRLAIRRALAAGYRRPGLIPCGPCGEAAEEVCALAFALEQQRLPASHRVPLFVGRSSDPRRAAAAAADGNSAGTARLADWFSDYEPDVVLGFSLTASALVSALGVRIPRDVAFIDLLRETDESRLAGVRQHCERAGELAVEVLVNLMQQNLRGRPQVPTTTLVGGEWVDGASLPQLRMPGWTANEGAAAPAGRNRAEVAA